jgi:hypothetical protein
VWRDRLEGCTKVMDWRNRLKGFDCGNHQGDGLEKRERLRRGCIGGKNDCG